ncbi:MAG: hypothetical protein ACD_80C00129G0007 [uncultured bacterium (gcode 4)]|uniref:Uncharacterized protein n=1 Tax=uncultured bacterium (gcode 4) TaxID=1234023 RepID=K1XIN5_9BACT|nr:MAG: hypothetical protein ACD_80C00129G0007 [uncultured bacterium (gcode 4)]
MEKTKKTIVSHVKKHEKKYIFGTWTIAWIGIFIVGVLLWSLISWKWSYTANEELDMYKSLDVFSRINDIAHLEIEEAEEEWNPFTEEGKQKFNALDLEFYNAANITEKFRIAKKIVDFLIEQEQYRPDVGTGDTDEERDEEFIELLNEFNQIQ